MSENFSSEYAKAGVNTSEGARAVDLIKPLVNSTHTPGVIGGIGGFGGMFDLTTILNNYKHPALVQGSDGVGTKMQIAQIMNKWDTVGIDCVAMCVNDLLCCGAEPIPFLDTITCGKNQPEIIYEIVNGVAEGCRQAGCALIGGEMAEHPGLMQVGEYDLQGFATGIVDQRKVLNKSDVQSGDTIIAIRSNGIHSNGFSLVRKNFNIAVDNHNHSLYKSGFGWSNTGDSFGEWLLRPTAIYVKTIQAVLEVAKIKSIAHITGGGIFENLPRAIPDGLTAFINRCALTNYDDIGLRNYFGFDMIRDSGEISQQDMYHTFNMGIGMTIIVDPEDTASVIKAIAEADHHSWPIGVVAITSSAPKVVLDHELNEY